MNGFLTLLGPLFGIAVGVALTMFLVRGREPHHDDKSAHQEAQERQAMRALMDAMRHEQSQLTGKLGALAETQERARAGRI